MFTDIGALKSPAEARRNFALVSKQARGVSFSISSAMMVDIVIPVAKVV